MPQIKIATWNINSVRLRIAQIEEFARTHAPDILCLQEIKCLPEQFPTEAVRALGYEHIEIKGQKGMHGVATLSRLPLQRMDTDFCPRGEARHVSTQVIWDQGPDFELHNFYVPAGGEEPDIEVNPKFAHKLEFLQNMNDYFTRRDRDAVEMVVVGDLNIAPHENDVWSHKQLLKVISHTPVEVEALANVQAAFNFIDCARAMIADEDKLYSWWSYRSRDINASDRGRRLDHIWVSPGLKTAAIRDGAHEIHRYARLWERPSDHAPVTQILKV